MSTKTSKPSNESSKRSLDRLWLIAADAILRERLRLELDGTEWDLRSVKRSSLVPMEESAREDVIVAAASVIAEDPDAVAGLPPATPLLLIGSPEWLGVMSVRFDDFLCDPWTGDELRYRLRRLAPVRRVACPGGTLSWGRYWISGVSRSGFARRSALSPTQYAILDVLGRSLEEPVAREALRAIAGIVAREGRALDMHVARLRSRLHGVTGSWRPQPRIRAYRIAGYRLEPS
jgi:hypothetical protein